MVDWKAILKRFTSRKFLTAMAAEVALFVSMFKPEYAETTENIIVRVGTIVGLVAVALGYIVAETVLDKESVLYGNQRNNKKKAN